MMQRYYFFCNHVSFSNGFWVSVLRPPPQGLSVAPIYLVIYLLLSDAKVAKPLLENEKFKR